MKHTILFLVANPLGTDRLGLDREARAIQVELERSGFRDSFALETRWAAEPLDLLRELRKLKPTVATLAAMAAPPVVLRSTAWCFRNPMAAPSLSRPKHSNRRSTQPGRRSSLWFSMPATASRRPRRC